MSKTPQEIADAAKAIRSDLSEEIDAMLALVVKANNHWVTLAFEKSMAKLSTTSRIDDREKLKEAVAKLTMLVDKIQKTGSFRNPVKFTVFHWLAVLIGLVWLVLQAYRSFH